MVRRVKHSDKESCANSPSPHKRMSFPLAYNIRCVAAVDHFSLAYQSLSHNRQNPIISHHGHAFPPAATYDENVQTGVNSSE